MKQDVVIGTKNTEVASSKIYIPEWHGLTEYEQTTLVSLSQFDEARTVWAIYTHVVGIILLSRLPQFTSKKFVDELKSLGGIRKLADRYRKEGYEILGYETFKKLLYEFELANWVRSRKVGKKIYFYPNKEILDGLKKQINSYFRNVSKSAVNKKLFYSMASPLERL